MQPLAESNQRPHHVCASAISFESRTTASSGAKGSLRTTDAITKGPAHAPRPASSTPAIGEIPALGKKLFDNLHKVTYLEHQLLEYM
jgi:hypothetical protein